MADVASVLAETVRRERGPILGGLLRLCGSVDAAEEALQEAVVSALEAWRGAVPANPGSWLMTAAKNKARDARRHHAVARAKAPLLVDDEVDGRESLDAVTDDYLRLVFTCCHPALAVDNQIALTLKVVCGFSTEEIARAFLCAEATVSQRILRSFERSRRSKKRRRHTRSPSGASLHRAWPRCSASSTRCSTKGTSVEPARGCGSISRRRRSGSHASSATCSRASPRRSGSSP
jgi:RNA polymerase sigma factor (sigma-70 family)